MKKSLLCVVLAVLMLASFCGVYAEDIVILYTNDVHCAYEDNLGYSSVAELKDFYKMYGKEKIQDAILYAKDLKNRYTVLWLYYDMFGENKTADII